MQYLSLIQRKVQNNNLNIHMQRSLKDIRHGVIKNQNQSHDANSMAELESQKSLRNQNQKRNKMQNFMNSTRMNASKIYKEQQQKKVESVNVKKNMLEKQRQLKAKYTIVDKKKDDPREINVQPTKVDWKKVEQHQRGVSVPQQRLIDNDSDDEASGIDSEYEQTQIRTPMELLKERQSIRNKMLNKFRQK